jgi:hypothetical protein
MTDVQIAELLKTRKGRIFFYIWYAIAFVYEYRLRILLTLAMIVSISVFCYLCENYW